MKITLKQAEKLAEDFKIDLKVIPIEQWHKGLNVELEHGTKFKMFKTNVTNDNLKLTGEIVIAHLLEYPDYYKRLEKLESQAEKYWDKKKEQKKYPKSIFKK